MSFLIIKPFVVKRIIFLLIAVPFAVRCFGEKVSFALLNKTEERSAYQFVSLTEAEKILGQPSHFKDSIWKTSPGLVRFMCTIDADSSDKSTGQASRLFFSFEQQKDEATAKEIFNSIKAENEKSSAITNMAETGDEGFVAKDASEFPFIMIRNKNKIFKLKLYYIKNSFAFEQLQALAKRLVAEN